MTGTPGVAGPPEEGGAPAVAPVTCGNGVLDPGEACDGADCPVACDDGDSCTLDALVGTAATCSARCESTVVTACASGDGCCPTGCSANDDGDCDAVCGNGVVEPGEACDGNCPEACDDGDVCTEDRLVGTSEACTATCEASIIDPCDADLARGIRLTELSVDQGIRVPLYADGAWIDADARRAPLIPGRRALVRADWALDSDFEARSLRAALTLRHADGTEDVLDDLHETDERPAYSYDDERDGFTWQVSAELLDPGVQLRVDVYEANASRRQLPLPTPAPRLPAAGELVDLAVEPRAVTMKVILVPIYHDLGSGCPAAPDLNASIERDGRVMAEYQYYRERLIAQNPIQDAEVTVHDPVAFRGSAESSSDIFTLLRQLREEENAEPWEYYYGVINPCDEGPGFSGVASRPTINGLPSQRQARSRVGWGRYRPDGRHAGTFVHEIGHNQGRLHVGCGGPSNVDPAYPNAGAAIGAWGWDIFTGAYASPEDRDYMSYCDPSWVSVYGWNLVLPWQEEISRWEFEPEKAEVETVLYATVQANGAAALWTGRVRGKRRASPARAVPVEFLSGSTVVATVEAEVEAIPRERGARLLVAPLPSSWSQVTHVAWPGGERARSAIRLLH